MLPIFVMYDSGLEAFERSCIDEAVCEFKELFPDEKVVVFGSHAVYDGKILDADWYIENAKSKVIPYQLYADSILDLMASEPWQKNQPHIDVLIVSRDLTYDRLKCCFGLSGGHGTVQSVYRYRNLNDFDERRMAIKTAVWHGLGHVFGMAADSKRTNTEDRLGSHCTNCGCAMRQATDYKECIQRAKDVKYAGTIYCSQCIDDVRKRKTRKELLNI